MPKRRGDTIRTAALGKDEPVVVIGVAADSGCGKSTFMRRLTNVFGGEQVGPLGGGFDNGGWETNTLVSDQTTVICLDDYHLNDRGGRKVTGRTALDLAENNFDLMCEQLKELKAGNAIKKPIYNHVNGTLDTPEEITPTQIVIVEGLHPMADPRVRELLDFSLYLDITDDVKFAWKIQRDMVERGHSLESIQQSIEAKKTRLRRVRRAAARRRRRRHPGAAHGSDSGREGGQGPQRRVPPLEHGDQVLRRAHAADDQDGRQPRLGQR